MIAHRLSLRLGRLRRLRGQGGFTLTEMLVVLAILGVLLGAFSLLLSTTIRSSGEIQEQNLTQTELRSAIDRLAAELRQAYAGDSSIQPIEVATGTALQFLSPDRSTPYRLRRLSYRLSGGTLERAIATSTNTGGPPWTFPALGPYAPLVTSVRNAAPFGYLDAARAVTTRAADVRTVDMTFAVSTSASPSRQYTYDTSVTLRASP